MKAFVEIKYSADDIERMASEYERVAAEANSVYRVVNYSLKTQWGQIIEMCDAITVLLITWNGRFYNPGLFSQSALRSWLLSHLKPLSELRGRNIASLNHGDDDQICELFGSLLPVLKPASGKWKGRSSPVSVGKALHLLAPDFFPAWDGYIASRFGCDYGRTVKYKSSAEVACDAYVTFCHKIRALAEKLAGVRTTSDKPLLKYIDECNYVTITLPSQQ